MTATDNNDKQLLFRLFPLILRDPAAARQNNPVYCYGTASELSEAAAWTGRQMEKVDLALRVCEITADAFTEELIRYIHSGRPMKDFASSYCGYDVLILRYPEKLARKELTMQKLYCVINEYLIKGRPIIVFSSASPADLEGVEERIVSQLTGGIVLHLEEAQV